jgi:hypothetical protein
MKVQSKRPVARASTSPQQPARAAQQQAQTKSTGWTPKAQSPAAQARALATFLNSPEGAPKAMQIAQTVAQRNDVARALNWEAADHGDVKPTADGKFELEVLLAVVKPDGNIKNHRFSAILDSKGNVLDVPQGEKGKPLGSPIDLDPGC